MKTVSTTIQYTYNEPKKGTADASGFPITPIFKKKVAIFHTHGGLTISANIFSPKDKYVADFFNMPIYVATPIGTLRRYDPVSGSDVEIALGF